MKFVKSNQNPFFRGLKPLIESYFQKEKLDTYGDYRLAVKGGLVVSIFIISYCSIYRPNPSTLSLICAYILMGFSGVMVVFNLVHDASHKSLSKRNWVNKAICLLGDLIGINTYIWNIRHNIQHHAFTNILGGDLIIENIPLIRLSRHQPLKPFHKFQIYYAPILYMVYSLYWMAVIDFKLFLKRDICNLRDLKHPAKEWGFLIAFKLFYLIYMIVFPIWFTSIGFWSVLGYFLLMHAAAGLLLSYVAVLGHFVVGPTFPDSPDGLIQNSWSEHELEATMDFAPKSRIIHWITGGLNTHVAHHLFPHICHVHYFRITPIIERYCKQNNYCYRQESLLDALASHFRYLNQLSRA